MASRGWIKLYRSMREHYLWNEKPFSRSQAWIDLLLMASHEDNKFLLGASLIEAKAGDIVTSEQKLIERWGWSKTKVRSFLKLLENDQMIIKRADRKIGNPGKTAHSSRRDGMLFRFKRHAAGRFMSYEDLRISRPLHSRR